MSLVSRRDLMKFGVGAAVAPHWLSLPRDAVQDWIDQKAVKIDGTQWEQKIVAAIGNARIVMLGEPSHGAGSAFAAKARLVPLLHERLGFDVLIWESGLIDVERTEAGLGGNLDPVLAAEDGIFRMWSGSAECKPLFEYVKASHAGGRPLTMAGFDMQLTAPGTLDYFGEQLKAFCGNSSLVEDFLGRFRTMYHYTEARDAKAAELGRAGITGQAQGAAMQAWDQTEGDGIRPTAEYLRRLTEASDRLSSVLKGNPDREAFFRRAVSGLAAFGANLYENQGKHPPEEAKRLAVSQENRRDKFNAETLEWQIDKLYAGRKVLVWAHNAHVMNAWYGPDFNSVSLRPVADGMKPMGVWLTDKYSAELFKVGFTAWQGSDAWMGPVPAAPVGSLEARLHALGAPEVFLPLRGLRQPVSMRIPKYKTESVANASSPYDALYFVDLTRPAVVS